MVVVVAPMLCAKQIAGYQGINTWLCHPGLLTTALLPSLAAVGRLKYCQKQSYPFQQS